MTRRLIVTADDFGLCAEVDEGIVLAHRCGIVTATSLMVRRAHAPDAVRVAASLPDLSLGLHVDLGEWVHREGEWVQVDVVVDTDDEQAVRDELDRQLGSFVRLTGRLPTHLDGHQHVQRSNPVAGVMREMSISLDVPLRLHHPTVEHRGDFFGQDGHGEPYGEGIEVAALVRLIGSLGEGVSEMGCHPGLGVPPSLTTYAVERSSEVVALCHPQVRAALVRHEVELCGPVGLGSGLTGSLTGSPAR